MSNVLTVKRGDSFNLLFSSVTADVPPVAQALPPCTARLQVRNKSGSRVYLSATSDPAAGLTIDLAAGTVLWQQDFTDTEALAPGTYYADLELTFSPTERQSTQTFQIRIEADMTQDLPA